MGTVRQVDFALEFSSTFAAFAESRAGCKINPTVPKFWQEKWCFGNWLSACVKHPCLCPKRRIRPPTLAKSRHWSLSSLSESNEWITHQWKFCWQFLSPSVTPVNSNLPRKEKSQILCFYGDYVKCDYLVFGIVPKAKLLQLKYCN